MDIKSIKSRLPAIQRVIDEETITEPLTPYIDGPKSIKLPLGEECMRKILAKGTGKDYELARIMLRISDMLVIYFSIRAKSYRPDALRLQRKILSQFPKKTVRDKSILLLYSTCVNKVKVGTDDDEEEEEE